jgi:hypothetical protein
VKQALRDIGFDSTYTGRRNILEGLEVHGLTAPLEMNRDVQMIAVPAVYLVIKHTHKEVSTILERLRVDIIREASAWQLSSRTLGIQN